MRDASDYVNADVGQCITDFLELRCVCEHKGYYPTAVHWGCYDNPYKKPPRYLYQSGLTLFENISAELTAQAVHMVRFYLEHERWPNDFSVFIEANRSILYYPIEVVHNDKKVKGTLRQIMATETAQLSMDKSSNALGAFFVEPSLIHEVCTVQVPTNKKWVRGNLLEILTMLGDFDYTRPDGTKSEGAVEKLTRLFLEREILSEEAIRQTIRKVLPDNWREIADKRMQPYRDALETFVKGLSTVTEAEAEEAWRKAIKGRLQPLQHDHTPFYFTADAVVDRFELPEGCLQDNPCVAIINEYWRVILPDSDDPDNETVTTGPAYDPRILVYAISMYLGDKNHESWINKYLGGFSSRKCDLYGLIAVGALRAALNPRDLLCCKIGRKDEDSYHAQQFTVIVPEADMALFSGYGCSRLMDVCKRDGIWGGGRRMMCPAIGGEYSSKIKSYVAQKETACDLMSGFQLQPEPEPKPRRCTIL